MKIFVLLLIVMLSPALKAQELNRFFSKADVFFRENVKDGKVAYADIHKDQTNLNGLLELAGAIAVDVSDAKNYQAFWVNTYNLIVIKGIIDNYPIKSPLDVKGFFDKTTYHISGKELALNTIENDMLRLEFQDARFHFVLVCGALGCPPLIDSAYLPDTINTQLEAQTKKALNGDFIQVNSKKKRVEVSEILKWYKEDFTRKGTTEIDFINRYRTEKIPDNFKLSYYSYNWSLNKQ